MICQRRFRCLLPPVKWRSLFSVAASWLSFIGSNEFSLLSFGLGSNAPACLWQVARRLVNGNQSGVVQSGVGQGIDRKHDCAGDSSPAASNPYQLCTAGRQDVCHHHLFACWQRSLAARCRRRLAQLACLSHHCQPGDLCLLMILIILHMLWFVIGWPQAKRQWKNIIGAMRLSATVCVNDLLITGQAQLLPHRPKCSVGAQS